MGHAAQTIDMKGNGCECCGCPICNDRHVPYVTVTLPLMEGVNCPTPNCDILLTGPHILTYNGNNVFVPPGETTALGCCSWGKLIYTDCPYADNIDPDPTPVYRILAQLCVVGCEEHPFTGTKTCQINWQVTVKALNSNVIETVWTSAFFFDAILEQRYIIVPCCESRNIGMVFTDGGPTCQGEFGDQNSTPNAACKPDDITACVAFVPTCDDEPPMPFVLALQESSAPMIPKISLFQKAKNVSEAFLRWSMAGYPKRSPDRIKEIYDKHCSVCPFFKNNECQKCGCPVVRGDNMRNKLLWATESCPDTPPRWEAEA